MTLIPNPEYAAAPIELGYLGENGEYIAAPMPYRFRSVEDAERWLATGDLQWTVMPYIEFWGSSPQRVVS